jgi:transcription elongation factor SPT6
MISAVGDVGLDINRLINSAALPYCLQFVSGLGPRKASSLISSIQSSGGLLENRSDLIRVCRIGKVVFMNCASFIRINPDSFPKRRAAGDTDILDNTRVHPEDYALARKMAADALEIVEVNDDENPSQHVEDVMQEPHLLDPLILEEYAKELLNSLGPKRATLEMIRHELKRPYQDPRFQYHSLNEDEVFGMITGETEKSLRPGLLITGIVARIKNGLVIVRLDSGLEGVVAMKNLSDAPIQSPEQVVRQGEALRCKVLEVNKPRFSVELAARRSALDYECILDKFFDTQAEELAKSKLKDFSKLKKPQIRTIKHPQFRNFGFREAEKYLANRPQGDLLFRPSSRDKSHLVVTWKVADGVYQHVEIEEHEKDNEYLLGKQLQINNQTFPDLDAVAVLFVEPMARCVRELLAFPKFMQGSRADLCMLLLLPGLYFILYNQPYRCPR